MAKTLNQIESQIAQLQREAQALRAKEVAGVVGRIQEAIAHYGLTAADLFGGKTAAPKKRGAAVVAGHVPATVKGNAAKVAEKKPPAPAKYRDDAGHSWSGHGKRPNWYKAAIAGGKTPQDLEVKA
jgi:DNA-binding protein H-NS